jgi:hypothetical protein
VGADRDVGLAAGVVLEFEVVRVREWLFEPALLAMALMVLSEAERLDWEYPW